MTPRERIIELLKSYPYACAAASVAGLGEHGKSRWESVALSHTDLWYAGSYDELERCLLDLRASDARVFWHVTQRYLDAEVRPMVVPVRRNQYKSFPVLAPYCELAGGLIGSTGGTCRVLVRRWDHRVRPTLVSEGLAYLERCMYGGRTGRIIVPPELMSETVAA